MAARRSAGLGSPGSGLDWLGSIMVEFDWPSIVQGWTGMGCIHLRKTRLGRKAVWAGYGSVGLVGVEHG